MYQFGMNSGACPSMGHARFDSNLVLCNAQISGGLERIRLENSGKEWTIYCFRNGCGCVWKIYVEKQRQSGQPKVLPLLVAQRASAPCRIIAFWRSGFLTR